MRKSAALGLAALGAIALCQCRPERPGCLDNPSGACVPASACEGYSVSCVSDTVSVYRLTAADQRPAGLHATAAAGDFVIENGAVRAVIDAVDHPRDLAESGGNLMDLAPRGGVDKLNQVLLATGILPRDAAFYESIDIGQEGSGRAWIIARGHLKGDPKALVFTKYELRACEKGLRIRTEIYNGGRIAQSYLLTDAYYWGGREFTPFVPVEKQGFDTPPLDLLELDKAYRNFQFLSAQTHAPPNVSYAVAPCNIDHLQGFNTTTISVAGLGPRAVLPGDGLAYERMIFVAEGSGSAPAQALALDLRRQIFLEPSVTVSGRFSFTNASPPASAGGDERVASLVFVEGDLANGTPAGEVVPDKEGRFSVRLFANKNYHLLPYQWGRPAGPPVEFKVAGDDVTLEPLTVPAPATLSVAVTSDGAPADAELVLVPTGATRAADVAGSVYGQFGACAPFLGPPHGASPACNRVLARAGGVQFFVPPGEYWVYATRGPASSLARARVALASGEAKSVGLALSTLPVFPASSLAADFHVHGGRSFDAAIPDYDRVLSFATSGVQVIAATDHDVVTSYDTTIELLNLRSRLFVMPGVELTQAVLHYTDKGSYVPRTLGHFNAWPMPYDPLMPRNGAPWDELREPGQIYDEVAPLVGRDGVMQLNHPYASSTLGRDEGYARAIAYDPRVEIPPQPDDSPAGVWRRAPKGHHTNLDFDAQEVMNGASFTNFVLYRALWYSFLRQGILRAGTANSDSHSLVIEQLGYPRNVVLGDFGFPDVDVAALNAAVREGRMVGTNGPYIEATLRDKIGIERGPSLSAIVPAPAAVFHVVVRAAPWIPVTELRIVANGQVKRTIPISDMARSDPSFAFGSAGIVRYDGYINVSELLSRDGFVVFEAGTALPEAIDTDDDGLVDTTDNNHDGKIDDADKKADTPLGEPADPAEDDPRFHVNVVSPHTIPTAFTNPFIIDFAGDGWSKPGL